jgi:hypothetical protein
MAKEIIPHKLITSYDENGKIKDSILQYKIREDGVVKNQFFTMSVKNGLDEKVNTVLLSAKVHAEKGEKIIKGRS